MARRRKDIVWPHLNDAGGDVSKLWYIEYSLRNSVSQEMERCRLYDGFREIKTIEDRYIFAKKIINELTQQIRSGEIRTEEVVEYKDMLTYGGYSSFVGKRVATPGSAKLLISEFIEYKQTEISEKTLQTYRSKFRYFFLFLEKKKLEDKPVSLITNQIVVEFLKEIVKERELSRKSVEKYQQILYTFFTYLIDVKHISINNPVLNIPRMGDVKDKSSAAIPREIRNKLQAIIEPEDPQLWMSICFIYYSAIRPGTELRLMKISQINFELKTAVVKNYLAKNHRTEVVDIPDQLHFLITEKWKLQKYDQDLYIFGKDNQPGQVPLGKNTMRIRFNKFRDRLKLSREIHYYSWKHSGAQELIESGANIYEVMKHLRHKDITTTEQYLRKRIGQRSEKIKHNFPEI